MRVIIELTSEEKEAAEAYARKHGFSLEEAFKQALFERIEDEYDLEAVDLAYAEYVASGCQAMTWAEFLKELEEEG